MPWPSAKCFHCLPIPYAGTTHDHNGRSTDHNANRKTKSRFAISCIWKVKKRFGCGVRPGGPFLERPANFSSPKNCSVFAVFVFKIKVSIILTTMHWNYQLTKQNWLLVSEEVCYYSSSFDFKICLRARKDIGTFEKRQLSFRTGDFARLLWAWPRLFS